MKITTEISGREIAVDGSFTNAIKYNDWALRIGCQTDDNTSRFEFTIPVKEVDDFINKIQLAMSELKTVQEKLGK